MPVVLRDNFPVSEPFGIPCGSDATSPRLKIGIVNLMPMKERTETDLLRILDRYPLIVEVDFIYMACHRCKVSSQNRIESFYTPFRAGDTLRAYDAVIVTGAPVELLPFEDVDYWNDLTALFDQTRSIGPSLFICWGAFASLYYFHGVGKDVLPKKISGVYPQTVLDFSDRAVAGFDRHFSVPCSRNTRLNPSDLEKSSVKTLVNGDETGPHLMADGKDYYVLGHWEYDPDTLDMEYRRDVSKGLNPEIPANYYIDDDPDKGFASNWLAYGNLFFRNWLDIVCFNKIKDVR